MDKTSSQHPGHVGVDLADDNVGRFAGCQGDIHGNPKTHPSEVIRGRGLNQGCVQGHEPGFKQSGNLGQINGGNEPWFF